MNAPGPAERPRWKLWHFSVVVLVAAPIFATIRAIGGEPGSLGFLEFLVVVGLAGAAPLMLIRGFRKLTGRATSGLKSWGVERGGPIGFLAWVVGGGLEVGFSVAAIVIAPIAIIVFLVWLGGRVGH